MYDTVIEKNAKERTCNYITEIGAKYKPIMLCTKMDVHSGGFFAVSEHTRG